MFFLLVQRFFLFVHSKGFCPYIFIFQGEYSLLILFLYFYHLNFHLKYLTQIDIIVKH